MNFKKWSICLLCLTFVMLFLAASLTAAVDPYFHYHLPLEGLQYPLNNQRYQNDGIVRHFDYNALVTGTSMTENFRTSEIDALFGVQSVKVSFAGATIGELVNVIEQAIEHTPDLELVILGIDQWYLVNGLTLISADGDFPSYLYDDNIFNDVNYLLNKNVLRSGTLGVFDYTWRGETTTTFDDYSYWNNMFVPYSAERTLNGYNRPEASEITYEFTGKMEATLADTLEQSFLKLARENPQIQFIYFFPPYSILNGDSLLRQGKLQQQMDAFRLASRLLMQEENIQLYSFYTDFETAVNLANYHDLMHYSADINSLMLRRFRAGEYRLTPDNCDAHWQQVQEFYESYDYEALLAGQ